MIETKSGNEKGHSAPPLGAGETLRVFSFVFITLDTGPRSPHAQSLVIQKSLIRRTSPHRISYANTYNL